ncbi:Na+/H+ antiporter NhaA, partial [Frankia sp. AvcI1]
MSQTPPRRFNLFDRGSWPETRRIAAILRRETIGGALLLTATVLALAWANSPWSDSYQSMLSYQLGPSWAHLNLTLAQWAADGLLAIFFFV